MYVQRKNYRCWNWIPREIESKMFVQRSHDRKRNGSSATVKTEENAATALHRYKSSGVNVLLNGAIRRPLNDSIIFRMINFQHFPWKFFHPFHRYFFKFLILQI